MILKNWQIYSKTLLETWKIWEGEVMEPSLYKSVSEEESLQFTRKKTETKKLSKTTQPTDPAYSEYPAYSEHTVCVLSKTSYHLPQSLST